MLPTTWAELAAFILTLPVAEQQQKMAVFDYLKDEFFVPTVCVEGKPEFHLTIN